MQKHRIKTETSICDKRCDEITISHISASLENTLTEWKVRPIKTNAELNSILQKIEEVYTVIEHFEEEEEQLFSEVSYEIITLIISIIKCTQLYQRRILLENKNTNSNNNNYKRLKKDLTSSETLSLSRLIYFGFIFCSSPWCKKFASLLLLQFELNLESNCSNECSDTKILVRNLSVQNSNEDCYCSITNSNSNNANNNNNIPECSESLAMKKEEEEEEQERKHKLNVNMVIDELIALMETLVSSWRSNTKETDEYENYRKWSISSVELHLLLSWQFDCIYYCLSSYKPSEFYTTTNYLYDIATVCYTNYKNYDNDNDNDNDKNKLAFSKTANYEYQSFLEQKWWSNVFCYGLVVTKPIAVLNTLSYVYEKIATNKITIVNAESSRVKMKDSEVKDNITIGNDTLIKYEYEEEHCEYHHQELMNLCRLHFFCRVMKVIMVKLMQATLQWQEIVNKSVLPVLTRFCDASLLELNEDFAKWSAHYPNLSVLNSDLSNIVKAASFSYFSGIEKEHANTTNSFVMNENTIFTNNNHHKNNCEEINLSYYIKLLCQVYATSPGEMQRFHDNNNNNNNNSNNNNSNNNNNNSNSFSSSSNEKKKDHTSMMTKRTTTKTERTLTQKQCECFIDPCVLFCVREHKWELAYQLLKWSTEEKNNVRLHECEEGEYSDTKNKYAWRNKWRHRLEKMNIINDVSNANMEENLYNAALELKESIIVTGHSSKLNSKRKCFHVIPEEEQEQSSSLPAQLLHMKAVIGKTAIVNIESVYNFMLAICHKKTYELSERKEWEQRREESLPAFIPRSNTNCNNTPELLELEQQNQYEQEKRQCTIGLCLQYVADCFLCHSNSLIWVQRMLIDPLALPLIICTFFELIEFLLHTVKDVPLARCYHTRVLYWLCNLTSSMRQTTNNQEIHHTSVKQTCVLYPLALQSWLATLHEFACVFVIPGCFMHHMPQIENLQNKDVLEGVNDMIYWQQVQESLQIFNQNSHKNKNNNKKNNNNSNKQQSKSKKLTAFAFRRAVNVYWASLVLHRKYNCNAKEVAAPALPHPLASVVATDDHDDDDHEHNNNIEGMNNSKHSVNTSILDKSYLFCVEPFTTVHISYNSQLEKLQVIRERHNDPFTLFTSCTGNENELQVNNNDTKEEQKNAINKICVMKHVSKVVIRTLINTVNELLERNRMDLKEGGKWSCKDQEKAVDNNNIIINYNNNDNNTVNVNRMRKIVWWQRRLALDKEMEHIICTLSNILFHSSSCSECDNTDNNNNHNNNNNYNTIDHKNKENNKIDSILFSLFVGDVSLVHRLQLESLTIECITKIKLWQPCSEINWHVATIKLFVVLEAMPNLLEHYFVSREEAGMNVENGQCTFMTESPQAPSTLNVSNEDKVLLLELQERRRKAKHFTDKRNNVHVRFAPHCSCKECQELLKQCGVIIEENLSQVFTNRFFATNEQTSKRFHTICKTLAEEVLISFYNELMSSHEITEVSLEESKEEKKSTTKEFYSNPELYVSEFNVNNDNSNSSSSSSSSSGDGNKVHSMSELAHSNLLETLREHLYLIIQQEQQEEEEEEENEENLFTLPWEGLPVLAHYSNSRVPDADYVEFCQQRHYAENKNAEAIYSSSSSSSYSSLLSSVTQTYKQCFLKEKISLEQESLKQANLTQMYLVIDPSATSHLNKYEEQQLNINASSEIVWNVTYTDKIYQRIAEHWSVETSRYSFLESELLPSNALGYVYVGHRRGEDIISRATLYNFIPDYYHHHYCNNHCVFSHYGEEWEEREEKQSCESNTCTSAHSDFSISQSSSSSSTLPLLVLLMSCSSAKLCGNSKCRATGMPMAFLEAGVLCFIGVAWDITDGEVDKCTLTLLEHLRMARMNFTNNAIKHKGYNKNNNNNNNINKINSMKYHKHALHIGTILKDAQQKCMLPFLSSASFVMYGYNLPLSLL